MISIRPKEIKRWPKELKAEWEHLVKTSEWEGLEAFRRRHPRRFEKGESESESRIDRKVRMTCTQLWQFHPRITVAATMEIAVLGGGSAIHLRHPTSFMIIDAVEYPRLLINMTDEQSEGMGTAKFQLAKRWSGLLPETVRMVCLEPLFWSRMSEVLTRRVREGALDPNNNASIEQHIKLTLLPTFFEILQRHRKDMIVSLEKLPNQYPKGGVVARLIKEVLRKEEQQSRRKGAD